MRILHIAQQFPGVVHSERSHEISSTGVIRLLTLLAGALVAGVMVETLLFRMFARTGIYLLKEDTAQWVFDFYHLAVWTGNTMFNFGAILAILLFAVIAAYLWLHREATGKSLPMLTALMVPWNIALFFYSEGTTLTLLYILSSTLIIVASIVVAWRSASITSRITLSLLGASFLCVYYFETIAPLRQTGWVFQDHGVLIFQVGEALALFGILAAFIAWGRTRSLKVIAFPALVGALLAGSYFSMPDRFPLISTWALGVTMSMPFLAYAISATLLGVTILKLLTSGRQIIAFGLVLLFFSHRMLPLTYFNLLILAGFLLISIAITNAKMCAAERTDSITNLKVQ